MAIKKKFIKIELPLLNEEIMALGTPETLDKKTIKIDLSRKLRGRSLEATFLVRNEDEKLVGYPKKLELTRQYIIRMMRKRVNYVEDSFEASCNDIECTIKPFLITRKKVSRAIRHNLRKTTKEFIIEYIKEKNYLDVCENILYAELQKEMSLKLKKIYPLSFCEIRILETKNLEKADKTIKEKTTREGDLEGNEESVEEKEPIKEEIIEEEKEKIEEEKEEGEIKPKKKPSKKETE
jgi:ribosomal protein S3AE